MLDKLPFEIFTLIFFYLGGRSRYRLSETCRILLRYCLSNGLPASSRMIPYGATNILADCNTIFNSSFDLSCVSLVRYKLKPKQSIKLPTNLINVREILFGYYFDQHIDGLASMLNLRIIDFGDRFNRSIKPLAKLINLTEVSFGFLFNQPIDAFADLINLRKITVGVCFNRSIKPLAKLINLREIEFGEKFNQPIDALAGLINLRKIKFGYKFNQPLDALSNLINLTEIEFGECFNCSLHVIIITLKMVRVPNHLIRLYIRST